MARRVIDVPVALDLGYAVERHVHAQLLHLDAKLLNLSRELGVSLAPCLFLRPVAEAAKGGRQAAAVLQAPLEHVERVVGLPAARGEAMDFVEGFL
jgi:hypothetical protein